MDVLGLPRGYGQVVYDGLQQAMWAGEHMSGLPWSELPQGIRDYYDKAAQVLIDYLERVPHG